MILRKLRTWARSIHWIVIVIFVGSIFLVWGMQYQTGALLSQSIATVDGVGIAEQYINIIYDRLYDYFSKLYKDFDPEKFGLFEYALDRTIEQKLLSKFAKRLGHVVLPQEIAGSIRSKFENDAQYQTYIRTLPVSYLRNEEAVVADDILSAKTRFTILNYVEVSEWELEKFYNYQFVSSEISHILINPQELVPIERIRKFYEENKEIFKKPGDRKVSHILVSLPEDATEVEREAAYRRALDILNKARQKDADFGKLAAEFSDDKTTKERQGDLGYLSEEIVEKHLKEFNVIFDMKKGDISNPILTKFGYHILKVDDVKTATTRAFEDKKVQKHIKRIFAHEYIKNAESLAKNLYERIKGGENFEELAKEYSHGASGIGGGYLGVVPKTYLLGVDKEQIEQWKDEITDGISIPPNLSKAIYSTPVGSVTTPILTPFGYHIVKVHKKIAPSSEFFQKNYLDIKKLYLNYKTNKIQRDFFNSLILKAKIQKNIRWGRKASAGD